MERVSEQQKSTLTNVELAAAITLLDRGVLFEYRPVEDEDPEGPWRWYVASTGRLSLSEVEGMVTWFNGIENGELRLHGTLLSVGAAAADAIGLVPTVRVVRRHPTYVGEQMLSNIANALAPFCEGISAGDALVDGEKLVKVTMYSLRDQVAELLLVLQSKSEVTPKP